MAAARSCAALTCPAVAAAAAARGTTAAIVGRVSDATGAARPGATIAIENVATHDVRAAPANGKYRVNLPPIAAYTARGERQGLTSQTTNVSLSAGDRARVDPQPEIGQVAENVTVVAESPLLQTDTATVSSLVSAKAAQDLPMSGRNAQRLVQLVPGTFEGLPKSRATGTRHQTSALRLTRQAEPSADRDGVGNNERAIGTVGLEPSIDAIAELVMQTSMFTADVGRTAGGELCVRHRGVRQHDTHRQQHPAADAVRREAALLG